MNLGPDADPMEAFRELFGQFAGQGGGSAPATSGRIASQPLPDLTPRPSPVAPAPQEYNPLDDVDSEPTANDMSDAAVNKRAWLAQGKNLPEPTQAPMGKRRAAPTGIQQTPGTSQPTQGQAPVPGSGAPKTPPPGATAASVASRPNTKMGARAPSQQSDLPAQGFGPSAGTSNGYSGDENDIMSFLDQNPDQAAELTNMSPPSPGMMMRDQRGQQAAMGQRLFGGGGTPPTAPIQGQPAMPKDMILQMLMDRMSRGQTQGNTPIR